MPVMVPSRPNKGAAVTTVFEYPQAAAEAFLDIARFIAGARFDPPRGLIAIVADHLKEPPVNVHRRECRQLPVEFIPGKAIGLDQLGQRSRQAQGSIVGDRPVENDEHGDDPEKQKRIYYRAAVLQLVQGTPEFIHR